MYASHSLHDLQSCGRANTIQAVRQQRIGDLMRNTPYKFDPAWNMRMLWFVDCGAGSRASFATTWDAARWISSNPSLRNQTVVIHIPSGVGPLLPEVVKVLRKPRGGKHDTREVVTNKVETAKTDREAVMDALVFVLPPNGVEAL